MALLCEKFSLTSSKHSLEGTSGDFSLPLKKRKVEPITINNVGYPSRRHMDLLPKLLSLGVDHPTWILRKTLAKTDLDKCESRLLLTSKIVVPTPLLRLLTKSELESVYDRAGLKFRGFDWLGREYKMIFKFLKSNNAYRVIGEWSRLLRENEGEMIVGDSIGIWAFHVQKREGGTEICMAFSLCKKDEELFDEMNDQTKDKKLQYEIDDQKKDEEEMLYESDDCQEERNVKSCLSERKGREELTMDERIAILALLELKGSTQA